MALTRSTARALAVFVEDVWRGSILLAQSITAFVRRTYRGARDLGASARAIKSPAANAADSEKGKPGPKTGASAPAANSSPEEKPAEEQEKGAVQPEGDAVKKAGRKGAKAAAQKAHGSLDRLVGAALAGWLAWCFAHRPAARGWHALAPDLAALMPWAVVWWTVAAWLTAQYDKNHRTEADADTAGAGDAGAPDAETVRAAGLWLWHTVCTRVAAAVAQGRKGVHLKTLIEEHLVPAAWTVETLREHCDRAGIPVKAMQIRGSGRGPTHGVHVDELTTALGMPLVAATKALAERLEQAFANTPLATAPGAVHEGLPEGEGEAAPAPRRGLTFEEALGVFFTGPTGPVGTPAHTPLPGPAPASPGRG